MSFRIEESDHDEFSAAVAVAREAGYVVELDTSFNRGWAADVYGDDTELAEAKIEKEEAAKIDPKSVEPIPPPAAIPPVTNDEADSTETVEPEAPAEVTAETPPPAESEGGSSDEEE